MSVPHFLRCSWCVKYLPEDQHKNHNCEFCSHEQERIWLRCPICLQAVRVDELEDQSALSIHLSHISAERCRRIGELLLKPILFKRKMEAAPEFWTEEFGKRAAKLGMLSTLPLQSLSLIDCDRLFWYCHRFR